MRKSRRGNSYSCHTRHVGSRAKELRRRIRWRRAYRRGCDVKTDILIPACIEASARKLECRGAAIAGSQAARKQNDGGAGSANALGPLGGHSERQKRRSTEKIPESQQPLPSKRPHFGRRYTKCVATVPARRSLKCAKNLRRTTAS